MAMNFTEEQQRVIEERGSSILVSAAAGSGKTAVLTQRIVEMVCDESHPVDIDRLLVVTFTNAAAAEMRERVSKKIAEKLQEFPDSDHIQRQAALLHNAQITTIDSFCLYILRNHFNEIGLDPAFRIADTGEIKLMQQEVLTNLLEDYFASGSTDFYHCVEFFCPGGRESVLEELILKLSSYASSFPWPGEWLEDRKKDYGAETVEALCNSDYGRYLMEYIQKMIGGWVQKMYLVQGLCQQPDGPYMYGENVDREIEQLERLLQCKTLEEYQQKLPTVKFDRLSGKKDETVSREKRELASNLRAEVKKSIQNLENAFFSTPLELVSEQSVACQKPVEMLLCMVMDFDSRMEEKKRDKKVVDFSDIEHFALQILTRKENGKILASPVAIEYRQHFAEVLIDEYQDSNLVQEYILSVISSEEDGKFNRFMVGDVKQSIYKFRQARPELFLEKYDTFLEKGSQIRIDLSKNFRSRPQVIDGVNAVFSRLMSRQVGKIEYDEKAALYPGADYPENPDAGCEMLLVEKPEKNGKYTEKQLEALAIANKIKKLRAEYPVTEKSTGELRPARYSDIAILLRTNAGWDEEFKSVLEQEGIPAFVDTKTGYFSATEVQELLQVLRILDNPNQDIPLFGVMKSVFGGFSEEEIALIRSKKKKASLYKAVKEFESEKTEKFLEFVDRYRQYAVYMPIRELLTKLVVEFDYLDYVTALPAGGKRRANVEMLFTRASDFEKTSYFGLFHFVRYIEQLEKYDVDYGEAAELNENADVVHIMSIHKSKGLEFPIVFVAGMGKGFNLMDAGQSVILDMDFGMGTDYVDPKRRVKNKTFRKNILSQKIKEEVLAEELRVLYVALTRAREKLLLTGTLDKASEKWEISQNQSMDRLSYSDFMEGRSYLDDLLPILSGTGIQVTVIDSEELETEKMTEQFDLALRRENLGRELVPDEQEKLISLLEKMETPYQYENLAGLYTKTTVSELKIAAMLDKDEAAYHQFEEKEIQPYIPRFLRKEEEVSATTRGNAYHRVMELLDFQKISDIGLLTDYKDEKSDRCEKQDLGRLREFLQGEVRIGRLKQEYLDAVNLKKILHFLQCSIGHRMYRAQMKGKLYREQPFVLGIAANRLKEEYPEEESVLIQGIIDVFFEEEDGIVLLDYKTDVVSSAGELWNRYQTQLDYYGEALERLMGKPVKEKILYSFHLEKCESGAEYE